MTAHVDRWAAYNAALALKRPDGSIQNVVLSQVAQQYQVGVSSLRRWLASGFPERRESAAWQPTRDDYVAIATSLDIKAAWQERHDDGLVPVSYQTYWRALMVNGDRGLIEAALHGRKGLINSRLYFQGRTMHRNHTWAFDHTELPIWVWTSGRTTRLIKPWVTIITETHTRALLVVMLIAGKPTAESIAAALAEAAQGRVYGDTWIGGLPVQMTYDNAAEHLGEVATKGIARMGIIGVPSDTYSSWQNAHAESKIGLLQKEALRGLPGVTMGGRNKEGAPRFSPPDQADLWNMNRLARHLDEFRNNWNSNRTQGALQGRTPVDVWNSDDTEILEIDEGRLVANMMKEAPAHKVNSKGVFFRNRYYVPLDGNAWKGRSVYVRYLERNADFISISTDRDFNDFRFAYTHDSLAPAHRQRMLAERAAQEQEARQIDADATARRAHGRAVERAGSNYEPSASSPDSDEDPTDHAGPFGRGNNHGDFDNDDAPSHAAPDAVTVYDTESTSPAGPRVRKSPRPAAPPTVDTSSLDRKRAAAAAQQVEKLGLVTPSQKRKQQEGQQP